MYVFMIFWRRAEPHRLLTRSYVPALKVAWVREDVYLLIVTPVNIFSTGFLTCLKI